MIYPEEILRHPLPPMPEKFPERIAQIASHHGKPMFRVVNGLTETQFRNGGMDIKHICPPYKVKIETTRYARKNIKTGEWSIFRTEDEARRAKDINLAFEIKVGTKHMVVSVGRPCWVVEVFVAPEELDYDTWLTERYHDLEESGVVRKVDVLGPFPAEGRYIRAFDVIDDEGNAVSPSDKTLEECKRRLRLVSLDTETVEDAIQGSVNAMTAFEEKQLEQMNDRYYQYHGSIARRAETGGVMSKPMKATA